MIFGEGITNDAVCIILFNTVMEFAGPDSVLNSATPFKILGNFCSLSVFSVLTGFVLGILSSIVFKNFRFLTHNPVIECNLIFCFGYLAYSIAELFHWSGIIALLTSGILMAHYTWYNLSPQAKQVTSVAFSVVGFAIEAFVFGYLGLTFFSYNEFDWSYGLIIAEVFIVCIGRMVGTVGTMYFL